MTPKEIFQTIKDKDVKFVDLRFTDTRGKEQHVSVPVTAFGPDKFESGHFFDGSSIAGWKGIQASDMVLLPDPTSSFIDPFLEQTTLAITCDVIEPSDGKGYDRDPRSIAKRGAAYLKSTGLGDTAYFGPEPEFFIFDAVEWSVDMSGSRVKIFSEEAAWTTGETYPNGNKGHRPAVKGGYFPVPPVDSLQNIRSEICTVLEQIGVIVEVHHHEVATAGQNEIGTKFAPLVQRADWMMRLKYVVHNVAHRHGKTATFMPKPIVGDNGSGMHVHQSIWKGEEEPLCRRRLCRTFRIRDLLHRRHHQACQGAECDHQSRHQLLQASRARLRSSDQSGLLGPQPFGRRAHSAGHQREGTPYRSALPRSDGELLSRLHRDDDGRTGWRAEQDPSGRSDGQESVRTRSAKKRRTFRIRALRSTKRWRTSTRIARFLTKGGVFSDDMIDAYIALKEEEVTRFRMTTHPVEFDMYYSL